MNIQYQVKKILRQEGTTLYFSKRIHGAGNFDTLCGLEMDDDWTIISSLAENHSKINCPQCKKIIRESEE